MKFFIFYAHVIFFAVVASAPVDYDDLIIGTGTGTATGTIGGLAVCDITNRDCSVPSKDYTISSADLNKASDGTDARVEAGAGKPSAFMDLFADNSDSSEVVTTPDFTSSKITPWTGSDLSTYKVGGNPPDTVKTPTVLYPIYNCENPWEQVPGATNVFLGQAVDGSFTADRSGENYKRSAKTGINILQCIMCKGPKDTDCKAMAAICKSLHSVCKLCGATGCESIEDVMYLPSRTNPKGQSWCNQPQCQQHYPT